MKCVDIMTINPGICVPEDNVTVAAQIMWDHDCGAVPVVKDTEKKELIGIVTDRDIAMYLARHACVHPQQASVADCMTSSVSYCCMDDPVEKAIQIMSEKQVRRVPIVDENSSCVGIISQADLLVHASEMLNDVISMLQKISIPWVQKPESVSEVESKSEPEKKE